MRRRIALALFVAAVATTVDLQLLRFVFLHYGELRQQSADPGVWQPDYPRFLEQVRARTKPGDTIAIVVPPVRWDDGYSYAYYRASYFLAGREVLPVVSPLDTVVGENLERAQYVALWRRLPGGTRPVLWRGHGGVLLGR